MMKSFSHIVGYIFLLAVLLLPGTTPIAGSASDALIAGESSCPEIVRVALDITQQVCDDTGRNQACYGHVLLDAQFQPNAGSFRFEQAGDQVNVAELQSLRISAMDLASQLWGVALFKLQASLPDVQENQSITMLLFGDVQVKNAMSDVRLASTRIISNASGNVNIRQRPSLASLVVGKLVPGEQVTATGRLEDGSWIRVRQPGTGVAGWVRSDLLTGESDAADLDAVDSDARYFGPMQAFTFQSGSNDALCPEAPNSGILIQTPEGVASVTLLINEVDIQLGSTVFFQAQPGEAMTVQVIEGSARITAFGQTSTAVAGAQVVVPIDANLVPSGPPSPPTAYAMEHVAALPVVLLERPVTVHAPLTEQEIAALISETELEESLIVEESTEDDPEEPSGTPDDGSAADPEDTTDPEEKDKPSNPGQDGSPPPGLVDNPGLGDSVPPGQNGSPPGLDDKDKTKDK